VSHTIDRTLDPLTDSIPLASDGPVRRPVLEVLFHSDISRIGDQTELDLLELDEPLVVGRDRPLFRDGNGNTAPLADPCISREQLQIACVARNSFAISPATTARRKVTLRTIDGEDVAPGKAVRPGTLIAIGDRVLLLLALRKERDNLDRMGLVGESEIMWAVRNKIRGAAVSDSTVLIHGESGSGKELVARSVHQASTRDRQPYLVVNCAAIPENLLESELFGHVRGAFTGADTSKVGFFKAAGKGTLFLDEIGELPLVMQGKLLRVLEERTVCPVGGVKEEPIQARVIAATNRDLRQEIGAGRFREDLYYRLTALTIEVPPLRQRREDIPALFSMFLEESASKHPPLRRFWQRASQLPPPIPSSFLEQLLQCDWPGNVRQLRNVVETTAIANLDRSSFCVPVEVADDLERGATTTVAHDAASIPKPRGQRSEPATLRADTIDEAKLLALLEENDYVQSRVAKAAGVSHTTVDRWMRELGLRRPRDLTREEVSDVAEQTNHDLEQMARLLKVSRRGLKLRMVTLGLSSE
jgi:two-component system nitrogen regulation response regulator GlnG